MSLDSKLVLWATTALFEDGCSWLLLEMRLCSEPLVVSGSVEASLRHRNRQGNS